MQKPIVGLLYKIGLQYYIHKCFSGKVVKSTHNVGLLLNSVLYKLNILYSGSPFTHVYFPCRLHDFTMTSDFIAEAM